MKALRVFFSVVLIAMIAVTTWAELEKGVIWGFGYLFAERWGIATLADAYCGFCTFSCWVFYKEKSWPARAIWFVLILLFGNIAMSSYALIQLRRLPKGAGVKEFLLA
jgi:hypothetical protein